MKANRRGMTYIELLGVIAVTALLASLALPNYTAFHRGQVERDFRARLQAIAVEGRSHAIETGLTTGLRYDRDSNSFRLLEEESDGAESELNRVDVPDEAVVTQFAADRYESPGDQWWVPFYTDGA